MNNNFGDYDGRHFFFKDKMWTVVKKEQRKISTNLYEEVWAISDGWGSWWRITTPELAEILRGDNLFD